MDVPPSESGRCTDPPELDDRTLVGIADGEIDEAHRRHLAHCPHCAARAATFAALEQHLHARLFRALCPASDDLTAYHEGLMSGVAAAAFAAHIAECPHCARELRLLQRAGALYTPHALHIALPRRR